MTAKKGASPTDGKKQGSARRGVQANQEADVPATEARGNGSFWANNLLLPALAVFTGLVVGGIIIALSNDAAIAAWGAFFQNPGAAFKASWDAVMQAYGALFAGALGRPADVFAGLQTYFATGEKDALYKAIYPFTESSGSLNTIHLHRFVGCGGISMRLVQHWS